MTEPQLVDIVRNVPLENLTKDGMPEDLRVTAEELLASGMTVADIATIVDESGYRLVIAPSGTVEDDLEDEDEDEDANEETMSVEIEAPGLSIEIEIGEDEENDEEEDDRGGLLGLLDRLRTVFGKAVSFETENASISRNRKRAAARSPHPFTAAVWATRKGVVRCRICGGPAPEIGTDCPGIGIARDVMDGYGEMAYGHEHEEILGDLTLRSAALSEAHDLIVDALGCFRQSDAHYIEESPFVDEGLACLNCVAYCPEVGGCYWVEGSIAPEGICKLWVIPERLRIVETMTKEIVEVEGRFRVTSADGTRSFGTYATRAEAEARLAEVERFSKAATKTEDGVAYPPEAFAYVPDPESPSTWKLRLWDSLEERETVAQVSRAVSALSPGGFRGQRVAIPAEDLPAVKARIRQAWERVNGPDREIPQILKAETFTPPAGVREEAQRAERWIEEGHAGGGFTATGRRRASDLAAGRGVSIDTIRRMASYLARHEVDKKGQGWSPGEPGYPSPGRVAWAAWGGDPAVSWTRGILDGMDKASPTVSDVHVDVPMGSGARRRRPASTPMMTSTLAKAIGVGSYVSWNSSGGRARGRVERIVTDGILRVPDSSFEITGTGDDPALLIRLWRETADGWRPTDTRVGHLLSTLTEIEPLERSAPTPGIFTKAEDRRYTLGPWYVPNSYDAHGEWTDAEELQAALWGYVRKGDRDIRLQHNVDVVAGEWVEALTWPFPVAVPMMNAETGQVIEQEFPANTVFMGVVWEPWAWDLVKAGKIRGYSMGGAGQRVTVDLPSEGTV